jgi:zeta-carotene desaturase
MQPDRAPLKAMGNVIRRAFFISRGHSDLGLPARPLGEILGGSVEQALSSRDGSVRLKTGVARIEIDGERLKGFTAQDETLEADAWVFAVPPDRLAALFPREPWAQVLPRLGKSPIVTAHLYLSRVVMDGHLIGLPGAEFEWVFNRNANWDLDIPGQVLSLVSSADKNLQACPEAELTALAFALLKDRLPGARKCELRAARVTREPAATFEWTPDSDAWRPGPSTPLPGVFLAGDWTDTGLPATLEGAVISGRRAARSVSGFAP